MTGIAVVTGSRKGLGWHIAQRLLEQEWMVHGCSRTWAGWSGDFLNYRHHLCDVRSKEQVVDMFAAIRKQHGFIDALVCNAGAASMNHVLMTPYASILGMAATNFIGTVLCCQEAARLMRSTGGSIVALTSIAVPMHLEGEAVYAATKAAVETFIQVLAREVARWGIRANCVGPALIQTDLLKGVSEEKLERIRSRLALDTKDSEEGVLDTIEFLLSSSSRQITGQVIYLGGPQ